MAATLHGKGPCNSWVEQSNDKLLVPACKGHTMASWWQYSSCYAWCTL